MERKTPPAIEIWVAQATQLRRTALSWGPRCLVGQLLPLAQQRWLTCQSQACGTWGHVAEERHRGSAACFGWGAWERTESGKPAAQLQASVSLGECMPEAARQKVTRQDNPARRIPKPGKERGCPARAQTLGCLGWERRRRLGCRGLALALLVPGCKRSLRKGKGEKEDRADAPLKAVRQKSSKLWG